jgi:hypothetical protein
VRNSSSRYFWAFIAGFAAVPAFHQLALTVLHLRHFTAATPFPMGPTWPFGIPAIWSLALWGGVWGLIYAWIEPRFPRGPLYWLAALLFGAIGPSLVAWFVVFPLKGMPVAGGFHQAVLMTGLIVNGAWGLGTALLLRGPLR